MVIPVVVLVGAIVGGVVAVMVVPWVGVGVAMLYFKLLRRDREMAWFDLPAFCVLMISGGIIHLTTETIVELVARISGKQILDRPPDWQRVSRR
ncbi:MAG TPA: hypothetical protein VM008_03975 [Phycisphaerae bacterium]|nr:hypothetical protein [Phycisphaerae bacterium]